MVSLAWWSSTADAQSAVVDWEDEVEGFHGIDLVTSDDGGVIVTGTLSTESYETSFATVRSPACDRRARCADSRSMFDRSLTTGG